MRHASQLALLVAASLAAGGAGAADGRLRSVPYDEGTVLGLTAFLGYHVHFEFAPDEHFVNLGGGDLSAVEVGAEGNHLLLKPRAATAGTNLTIITDRRVYFIDYRALARAPHPDEAVYSVRYRYPPAPVPTQETGERRAGGRIEAPPGTMYRDYWYGGDPTLRPEVAFDDGLQLKLRFPAQASLPAIYAVSDDGTESLVNTHVEDDWVVVHHLASRFVLRRGAARGCVVDRNLRAAARRAASGTIDPATERAIAPEVP
jgi:type IV secretion system protein VirB9